MALVRQPTLVSISFKDRARSAFSQFHMGDALGVPPDPMLLGAPSGVAPFSFVYELYNNMQDVSDCAGDGYSITYSWAETPTLPVPSTGNPNVERKGVFQNSAGIAKTIFSVPGIKLACQAADGRHLIYTLDGTGNPIFGGAFAGDLQSIHDKLRNGATITAINYPVVTYLGMNIDGFVDAYQQTRKSPGKG